ncbi:MAG: hypothetical protein RR290_01280 [Clostridia bacterium]
MHVFNISFIIKYKLYIIVSLAVTIAIILIIISFSSVIKLPKIDKIDGVDILKSNSYYAEYNITEISNKNRNIYSMKEWYKKVFGNEFFKFSYYDKLKNEVSYIIANGRAKIENSAQLNTYIVNENSIKKTNLYSISTYIDMINNLEKNKCIKINIIGEENTKKIEIILDRVLHSKCENCKYNDLFSDGLKIDKIEISILKNIPKNILVFKNDNEVYLDIDCLKFDNNINILDNMFVF